MGKTLRHRHRYAVQYKLMGFWCNESSFVTLESAQEKARYKESLGVFKYRVRDTYNRRERKDARRV